MNMRFGNQEAGQSFCDLASLLFPNTQPAISNVTIPINWVHSSQSAVCRGSPISVPVMGTAAQGDLQGLVS